MCRFGAIYGVSLYTIFCIIHFKIEKIVLITQDTTDISFTGSKPINGMGYLSAKNSQGFYLHPSLVITPERLCLGVIDLHTWTRKKLGLRKTRQNNPIKKRNILLVKRI